MAGLRISDIKKTTKRDYDIKSVLDGLSKIIEPQNQKTLSVCIITKEEYSLKRAIESVEDVADEIIVVSCITRADMQVGKCKYYYREWTDDFAAARNFALEKATCDYWMWLDSDDYIPPRSAEMIKAAMETPGPLTKANKTYFTFRVINTIKGSPVGDRFDQPRLYPRIAEIKWDGRVHETTAECLNKLNIQNTICPNIEIYHYGYEDDEELQQKMNRNEKLIKMEPDSPLKYYHLGNICYARNGFKEAATTWQQVVDRFGVELEPMFAEHLKYCIGKAHYYDGQHELALRFLQKSEKADALYYLGETHKSMGNDEEAIKVFREYLKKPAIVDPYCTGDKYLRKMSYVAILTIMKKHFDEVQAEARLEGYGT